MLIFFFKKSSSIYYRNTVERNSFQSLGLLPCNRLLFRRSSSLLIGFSDKLIYSRQAQLIPLFLPRKDSIGEKVNMLISSLTLQTINFTQPFYAAPVVLVTPKRGAVNNDNANLSGTHCIAVTAWVEVRNVK